MLVVDLKKPLRTAALTLLASALLLFALGSRLQALQLSNRSVAISSAVPSIVTNHSFKFLVPSTGIIGSIVFEYCSNSPLFDQPCTVPSGIDVSSAGLTSQSGNVGFSVDSSDTTANKLIISRAPLNSAVINSTYGFSNITNPSSSGTPTFVRISTYASANGTGSYSDNGAVAFVTQTVFSVGAAVPPFLQLCVGITISLNCSSVFGSNLDLGILSAKQANAGQSQLAGATNSASGYSVYSLGTTMTSGNNTIPALNSPSVSLPSNNQFGINLRANSIPAIGQNTSGPGNLTPTANYNQQNFFMFSGGDAIASASQPSDYNLLTVSYLVNVLPSQPPGVYSTTITYLGVAQF